MSEVFNIETPPNLIEATLARLDEPIEIDETAVQTRTVPGIRWLAAAMIVLALGLSVYVMWQPPGSGDNGSTLLGGGDVPAAEEIDEIKELIESAASIKVRSLVSSTGVPGYVQLEAESTEGALKAISKSFTEISNKQVNWNPTKQAILQFSDGEGVLMYGAGNIVSLKLPGWDEAQDYQTDGTFKNVLQPWVDESIKNGVREIADPRNNWEVDQKWEGSDSAIKTREVRVISDNKSWLGLWDDHMPSRDKFILPNVDFESKVVLAVFGGKGFNSNGFRVDSILNGPGAILVRIDEETYQTAGKAMPCTPYGFWVIPNNRRFVVEENIQGLLNKPPLWKSIKDYSPPNMENWNWGGPRAHHTISGEDFQISGNETYILTTQDEWESLKKRAVGDLQINIDWPDVDFRNQWIYARFSQGMKGMGGFKLKISGEDKTNVHFRVSTPGTLKEGYLGPSNIHGIWVLSRDPRNWVCETPVYGEIGDPANWQEHKPFIVKQKFGVIASKTVYDGKHTSADYKLVRDAKTLSELAKSSGISLPKNFADFDKEMVLVVLDAKQLLFEGISIAVEGESKITYSMVGPSGVNPGMHSQVGFFVLPKHDKAISLYRSVTIGPSQPNVKLVKKFE